MKLVAQKDPYGCAVACVAMVMEISYDDALLLFLKPENSKNKGFYCREIVDVLSQQITQWHFRYIKRTENTILFDEKTIIYMKKGKQYPAGHYVVKDKNYWLDPWINFPEFPICSGIRSELPERAIYAVLSQS